MGPQAHGPQGDAVARFVLLHGLAGQPEQWRWLEAELRGRGHDTLALDAYRPTWDATIDALAAVAEDAIVVGHSLGGLVVRLLGRARPGLAAALATIAAPPDDYRAPWFGEVGRVSEQRSYVVTDLDRFLAIAFPGALAEVREWAWETAMPAGEPPAVKGDGGEPRLVIVCEDDDAVPYDLQREVATRWPAPIASVPGGHSPHVRHPALVATLLLNWLTPEGA